MIEHLRAPDRITYPVKSTRMIGDELWVQLDTTVRDEVPMSRWFKAFDLAGLWQVNHPAIDRLRGVTPPFETGMMYDQPAEAPLYYTVPLPPGFVLEVEMPADLRGAITYTKGVKLVQPTLWAEEMKVA